MDSKFSLAHLNDMKEITDDEVAQIGRALGDPHRLAIYTQIAEHEELFCGEILAKQSISAPTLSHHLKVMTELELIASRKDGLNVFYRVVPETFAKYLKYLSHLAQKTRR